MNLSPQKKPLTLLFNPFFYVAGGKALGIGLAAMLLAGLVGALGHTHFDGVLDMHTGAHAPLWFFLAEGLIDWLCLGGVLLVLGLAVSKTAFRALDVVGTQALARWPSLLVALLMLPGAVGRFTAQLVGLISHPEASRAINIPDAIVFCVVVLASIPITCWMVYLMYKAYSVSCNVKGGKGIGTFIGGLFAGEILSKLCIVLVLAPGLASAGFKAPVPTAVAAVESSSGQTNTPPGDLADAGGQFVNMLAKEDFAAAVAQFNPRMTKALPEARLRATWQDTVKQLGPYQKQLRTRTKEQAGYHAVLVTCQFERAALDVKVVYDAQSRVSGLWFVRSGSTLNRLAIPHVIAGLLIMALSVPLIKRKVKMNHWYGVRIPEAFKSEARWFEINEYGGRLLLGWGICMAMVAVIGLTLPKTYGRIYSFSALGIIGAGLGLVVILIFRYAARTRRN